MADDPHRSGDPIADLRAAHARDYAQGGEFEVAADLMRQALERAPDWTAGRMQLADFLLQAERDTEARTIFQGILDADPADPYGAELKLASLGALPVPAAPSPLFVAGLFDQYAPRFEEALVNRLGYRVPDLLLGAIDRLAGTDRRFARTLDLGCGTGLMGERLRERTDWLEGVDLSPGMLERARRKGLYDALREGDILEPFAAEPFDLVTAADVLTYLGDLEPAFRRIAETARPGAPVAFSFEVEETAEPFTLRASLRYAHRPDHVRSLLVACGFETVAIERAVIRRDAGADVAGAIVTARRAGR
ncbi:methyltransferase domain-containing protein [Aureimonas sp. AU4]|uniref:methyltransferase domain-containing protein n=1 Tax=Aureimonas sp. AU4 TaxID=1638163 RepID=UPI0009E83111|nr:methyltransferase domain-containing protein [Aureimonas sp. AU4]